ncbi:MAG: alpha/beta fold hydrolase [Thermodesulfobacteriota bacterium]
MPYTRVNGINIYYEVRGEGPPVVLIGGLGSQINSWATQTPLYSKYFKVIAFDNRGAGLSDKPGHSYTTEDMADETAGLLDTIGIHSASFVGKSMGGMIAQWLGIKYPDRVNKLVLGCTSPSRDDVGNEILRIGREIATKVGLKTVWLTALYLGYTREYIENNLGSIKESLGLVIENDEAINGYVGQSLACETHDTRALLHKIKCPTLVLLGENDQITSPRKSRELAELIPGAVLREFSGVGHGFWRERQEEVDKVVLDFLLER